MRDLPIDQYNMVHLWPSLSLSAGKAVTADHLRINTAALATPPAPNTTPAEGTRLKHLSQSCQVPAFPLPSSCQAKRGKEAPGMGKEESMQPRDREE